MNIKYRIESWNPITNKYYIIWEGPEEYTKTMMNKSYNMKRTRRLVKITTEIISQTKANEYVKEG